MTEAMDEKKISKILLTGIAAAEVIKKQIGAQDEEALNTIIRLSAHSCDRWEEVIKLAKEQKEILEGGKFLKEVLNGNK